MADIKVYTIKIDGIDQANEELSDLNKTLEKVSAEKRADSFKKLGESLAGAFATATVAADAFGISGKTLQEAQTRATQLVVALDGVKKITEGLSSENLKFAKSAFDSFKSAGIGAKLFGTATRTAITASGIGALLLLLPLIIENFDKIKEVALKAFNFTPLGVFVKYITDLVDKLGGLGNIINGVSAAFKSLFDKNTTAAQAFNKEIEKGKAIQALEKQNELLKEANEERQRQIRILEATGGKEKEIFELKKKIFKEELDNIQALKRAGQELNEDQIKKAKDLDTELKVLQAQENKRLADKAAKDKEARDKANAQRLKDEADADKARQEALEKRLEEYNKKRLEDLKKGLNVTIPIPSPEEVAASMQKALAARNAVLANQPKIQVKSVFDYLFGTGEGKLEADEDKQAAIQIALDTAVQAYNLAFSAVLGALDQRIESTRDRLDSVETETQSTLSNINSLEEQLNDAQGARREQILARLEKEKQKEKELANEKKKLADKIAADEKKRLNLKKAQDIAQATVNTALGITRALADAGPIAGPILAAVIGALGAVQIGVIASQKLEDGGVLRGPSHANGGIPIEAEGGEAVINKRSTAMFKPILSAINQAGGGVAFENGGVTPDFSTIQSTIAPMFDPNSMVKAMQNMKFKIAVTEFTDVLESSKLSEDRASF